MDRDGVGPSRSGRTRVVIPEDMVFACIRPEAGDEMKVHQNIRHFATKKALIMPVIGDIAAEKVVSLHVRIFNRRADPDRRGEREDHMAAFSEYAFNTYLAALDAGFPEAGTHEITHIQANFGFHNYGWAEMMEIPVDEIEAHYERYEKLFERHGINTAEPPGEFCTIDIPDTPATLDRLDDPDHPHVEGGFADDVYVEDDLGGVGIGGADEPGDMDVSTTPGMQDVDRIDERTA